jgi:cobyrinic acid a,c-diamide synthase
VVPFKKGPDYIDAGWLAFAAGHPCFNLDPFLTGWEQVSRSFLSRSTPGSVAVIEGNRGLFDGLDAEGSYSTAELAKRLVAPVVLILDCTKVTRTVASFVIGCQRFDEAVHLAGVVLNRVAGARHEGVVRAAIEQYTGLRVLGAFPKLSGDLAERHMGLVPSHEIPEAHAVLNYSAETARKYLDLDALWEVAQASPPLEGEPLVSERRELASAPRIGVIRDAAFWFYYPENFEAIEEAGGQIVWLDALKDAELAPIDGLYIGGGFPETFAARLAENRGFRESLRAAIEDGLPVYAECGGLMYLGRAIEVEGESYPMVGVLPVSFGLSRKPQGHGYTVLEADGPPNPYYRAGAVIHGHEFRYSRVQGWEEGLLPLAFKAKRGHGFDGQRDGLIYKNVLASYTHVHALGVREWAVSLVDMAAGRRAKRFRSHKNLLLSE